MKICAFDPCENIRRPKSRLCSTHKSQRDRGKELTAIPPKLTDAERFWSYVDKSGDCWNWVGLIRTDGYGQITVGGRKGKQWLSHRFSYAMAHGSVDDGQIIDHRCINRACVNPAHLRPASNKQNMENRAGANKNSKSGVLGVCQAPKSEKWIAQITHHRQAMHLGRFDTIAEAEAAVTAKRLELFTYNELDRASA